MISTEERVQTTQEIADRFYELAQQGKFPEIQSELYSDDARSIEPEHTKSQGNGFQDVKGRDMLHKKAENFQQQTEEMHGGYCDKPIVAGNHFAVAMGMDATMKGMGRMKMDEIAVYEVKDGKIVKEQFFF